MCIWDTERMSAFFRIYCFGVVFVPALMASNLSICLQLMFFLFLYVYLNVYGDHWFSQTLKIMLHSAM